MAVGMLLNLPGVTQEQYEQVTEKIFGQYPMRADQAPDGLRMHSAGTGEDGWYVYDIWDSPEHFQRFAEQHVGPAMAEVVGEGGPPPQPQFFPVHGFVFAG
jgi:hypothetical protein